MKKGRRADAKTTSSRNENASPTSSTETSSLALEESGIQTAKKEAALNVLKIYLDAVIKGGNEVNWDLSSEAAHSSILKQFSSEEQDREHFLAIFREGVAHEQLISYTVKEVNLYDDQIQVVLLTQRKNVAEAPLSTEPKVYTSADTFKMIQENGQWKVDWVIGGAFKPF